MTPVMDVSELSDRLETMAENEENPTPDPVQYDAPVEQVAEAPEVEPTPVEEPEPEVVEDVKRWALQLKPRLAKLFRKRGPQLDDTGDEQVSTG